MQKNVVIIEPSAAGIKIINASLNLQHKVYVLTKNSDDRMIARHHLNGCEVIQIDTNDELAVKKELENLNSQISIDAILRGFEYYVPCSARLNAHFGLSGLPVKTADAFHFKHKMRQHLLECGI